eukprot:CAMPEP_0114177408 /NCGR_PEP_ID=MMETSP0043_2-20121206/38006_1 /TAXON_ID=464988 /ORGANISM="Hemiselmis andersenii, Strain CCMP644" /LENGTH=215 /DNA_ID=CAMNT_0001275775 /DNA_START=146 /DNA_END=791 /DNA_ORIENTATION=-
MSLLKRSTSEGKLGHLVAEEEALKESVRPARAPSLGSRSESCDLDEGDGEREAWVNAENAASFEEEGLGEVDTVFDDGYVQSIMNRTKNGKQRTFEYSLDKLEASLRWRREYGAAEVTYQDVAQSLAPQHMIWHGFDSLGRPILYVKPSKMDLSTYNTENYLKAHVYLLERGISMIPKGETTFVLVADASGLGNKHTDLKLMRQLAHIATLAYPD